MAGTVRRNLNLALETEAARLDGRVDRLSSYTGSVHETVKTLQAVTTRLADERLRLERGGFWGRLRWLVTGRV